MAYHEPLELVVCFGEDLDPRQRNGTEVSRAELGTEYGSVYEHDSTSSLGGSDHALWRIMNLSSLSYASARISTLGSVMVRKCPAPNSGSKPEPCIMRS